MKFFLGLILGLFVVTTASADSVWTYTGNTMNGFVNSSQSFSEPDCNCALDGTVTLSSALNPVLWTFTDGTHTLTQANSTALIDPFEQSSIPFQTWLVHIAGGGVEFWSQFTGSNGEATDFSAVNGSLLGYEEGNHGTWTASVAATEPATALLVGVGLAAVGLMRRKKKTLDTSGWENLG